MFSLICTLINGWVNNREAGNLRRHGAYYDVTVITLAGAGDSQEANWLNRAFLLKLVSDYFWALIQYKNVLLPV